MIHIVCDDSCSLISNLTSSPLLSYFFHEGANGKGSIGIGINARVKEVISKKATNPYEVGALPCLEMCITLS